MPTYQYRCTECGHDLEVVQRFSDAALTECPNCAGQLRKVFNAVGVVFKGSGFYRTDSRAGNGAAGDGKSGTESASESGSKTDAGNGSKSDAGNGSKSDAGNGSKSDAGKGSKDGSGKGSGTGTGTKQPAASSSASSTAS
jgi:putative FmdB family regulatory protein